MLGIQMRAHSLEQHENLKNYRYPNQHYTYPCYTHVK